MKAPKAQTTKSITVTLYHDRDTKNKRRYNEVNEGEGIQEVIGTLYIHKSSPIAAFNVLQMTLEGVEA